LAKASIIGSIDQAHRLRIIAFIRIKLYFN
jgi:hypothetical protein